MTIGFHKGDIISIKSKTMERYDGKVIDILEDQVLILPQYRIYRIIQDPERAGTIDMYMTADANLFYTIHISKDSIESWNYVRVIDMRYVSVIYEQNNFYRMFENTECVFNYFDKDGYCINEQDPLI